MSKPPKKLKGRPATDERGNSTWKWVGDTGTEIETEHVKALGEGLSLEAPPQKVVVDPYDQPQGKERTKGRSLDDMRRLDQEMKREHEALVKRLRQPTSKKSDSPPTRRMRLRFEDRELLVDERHPSVTVGRAEDNDVVVTRERVSRVHVRIELSRNKFELIDQSTNGTFVQSADGEESFIRRGRLPLKGQGMIGLGRRPRQGSTHTIRFTCEEV
jgi:FHA domain-containing protein